MEGSRRCSTALLALLLALLLAASSTTAAAAAGHRQPPTDGSYKLIAVWTGLGDQEVQAKLAVRADGSSIAGFANNKNDWFAIQGSEDLLQPYHDRYGGDDIPGRGFLPLVAGMLKK